jgi:hypothetical protein
MEVKMKALRSLIVVCLVSAAAIGVALTAGAQQDKKPRQILWEYRDGANLTVSQLNTLGADGWELIVMTQYDKNLYYILKRPKL